MKKKDEQPETTMQSAALESRPDTDNCSDDNVLWDLVQRAIQGDQVAFEQIYRQHVSMVFGLCLRLSADRIEAEILTQDTFVRAWTKLSTYSGSGALAGWLRRLAVNVVYDQKRADQRRHRLIEPFPLNGQDTADEDTVGTRGGGRVAGTSAAALDPARAATAIDLERAIARLPKGARTVFVLHDVEGYRYREIAEMVGTALGTVKAQLFRARRLLRVMLER